MSRSHTYPELCTTETAQADTNLHGLSQWDADVCRLHQGASEERKRAAERLRHWGALAVEPLSLALRDPDLNVRAMAAESLGHIGDVRAVRPLMEVLQRCSIGISAHHRYMLYPTVFPAFCLAVCLIGFGWRYGLWACLMGFVFIVGNAAIQMARTDQRWRRSQSRICQIIPEALARIAERDPTPEIRKILPELRFIAADVGLHGKTRAASLRAMQRIEASTERLKDLPLPASAPAPDTATLPRVGHMFTPDAENLPRPANG